MLTQLIKQQIDTNPAVRKRLVSAILLGGNVTVPVGKDVGGSFQQVPGVPIQTARRAAWWPTRASSIRRRPTACSVGRGSPASRCCAPTRPPWAEDRRPCPPSSRPRHRAWSGHVAGAGHGRRHGLGHLPRALHGAVQGQPAGPTGCRSRPPPGDTRPVVTQQLGPTWGLHLVDVNIASATCHPGRHQVESYHG